MKTVILATTVALLMVGCGDTAPKCDDSDSKNLIIEIAQNNSYNSFGLSYDRTADKFIANGETLSYDDLLSKYPDKNFVVKVQNYRDATLKNIRTSSIDDELQKSTCKAQVVLPGIGYVNDITYEISKTSEGELFAEVNGLVR